MKHWLFAAGAAALMASIALPVVAAEEKTCRAAEPDPALEARLRASDANLRASLQKGVDRGVAQDMIDLASLLEHGGYVEPINRAAALDLYERAAQKGDTIGRRKMCVAYLLGEGRPKDAARGMDFCNALDDKDPVGLFARGYDYQTGLTGPADEGIAMGFYIDAVKAGDGDAAAAMAGIAIKAGKLDLARQWFQRGTYLGSADAMDGLAAMTDAGQASPADAGEAGWLYQNAAGLGNAHAAQQLAGRTVDIRHLCPSYKSKPTVGNGLTFTHSYTDKKGPKTEVLSFTQLIGLLSAHYPDVLMENEREGSASISCYVDARNVVDACILGREYPASLGVGKVLEALFNGHMTASETDDVGAPTAQRWLNLNVHWKTDTTVPSPRMFPAG